MENIVIIGQGAIGSALAERAKQLYPRAKLNIFTRNPKTGQHAIDYNLESSIENAAKIAGSNPIDLLIVATGILHNSRLFPEKSVKELNPENLQEVYFANTIVPALIAKHFLPIMQKKEPAIFAAISARVGSISDNRLGGWYAYRASKAALNMIIKNLSIEFRRFNKNFIIVGLHPGTVESNLSSPFKRNVPNDKLFTPKYSASRLLEVISNLKQQNSGKCYDWEGLEILP